MDEADTGDALLIKMVNADRSDARLLKWKWHSISFRPRDMIPAASHATGLTGAKMISPYALPLLFAGFAWQAVCAAPLYKWVDGTGHVTYSSLPPPAGARARTIEIPPQPSAEETRQAEARAKRTQEQASEMEDRRRKQEEKEAEEARLRAMQTPPAPVVIEKPVYVPEPIYYPPVGKPHRERHHDKPPRHRSR